MIEYQSHLSEAMKRLSTEDAVDRYIFTSISFKFLIIDRKLISNLLVQYISAPRGDKTRYEMLNVIAGILRLTEKEKFKCGLSRYRPVEHKPTQKAPGEVR